jgi:hypothetical protein
MSSLATKAIDDFWKKLRQERRKVKHTPGQSLRRHRPNQYLASDWRFGVPARNQTTIAKFREAIKVHRKLIEHELWGGKDYRLHRLRMQEAGRDFDALLLRDEERRKGGRPKGSKDRLGRRVGARMSRMQIGGARKVA